MTGRLHDLFEQYGQSPWLDNLQRSWLDSGELASWVGRGVRGLTSNPSIFAKAMTSTADYDAQLGELAAAGASAEEAYWALCEADIAAAADVFALHRSSGGADGFVSVEVDPGLAERTEETVAAALDLTSRLRRPNVLVKVPATAAGLPAVTRLVAAGINVNVTLIFGLTRYAQVIDAYMAGLEARPGDLTSAASVASFFVSRVDSEVDRRLEDLGGDAAAALRGQAAIAQARAAYRIFTDRFSSGRWAALADRGARPQRPLWASTSTKNPAYPDTLYVDELIGPETVNTLPDATLAAFLDHGSLGRTIDGPGDDPEVVLERLESVGIDLAGVSAQLESEGVAAFAKSFDEVLASLQARMDQLRAPRS